MDELEIMDYDEFIGLFGGSKKKKNDLDSTFSSYNSETGKNEPPKKFSSNNKEDKND